MTVRWPPPSLTEWQRLICLKREAERDAGRNEYHIGSVADAKRMSHEGFEIIYGRVMPAPSCE